MAEEKNTNVEEVIAETTAVEVPQPNEAQANPEQFLKDFNWHNYEEGIDPVDDEKLVEFEKLVASNFVDTLDDQVVDGVVIHISDRDAIIDINAKSEGVISLNEFRYNPNLAVGDKVTLDNILFKTGYSYVIKESIPVLEMMAAALKERDDIYFTIQGHVCCTLNARDAVDKKTGRRNLSLARAKYIYSYLVEKGVKRTRMHYVGLKNKYPLGKDPKYDRRVEIKITSISNKN